MDIAIIIFFGVFSLLLVAGIFIFLASGKKEE